MSFGGWYQWAFWKVFCYLIHMAFQKDASLFSFFGFFPFIFLYEIEKYSNLFLIGKVPNKSLEFFSLWRRCFAGWIKRLYQLETWLLQRCSIIKGELRTFPISFWSTEVLRILGKWQLSISIAPEIQHHRNWAASWLIVRPLERQCICLAQGLGLPALFFLPCIFPLGNLCASEIENKQLTPDS